MSGTSEAAKKVVARIKEQYGENYFRELGRKGGTRVDPNNRWWARHPELAIEAGSKGGKKSKRGKACGKYTTVTTVS